MTGFDEDFSAKLDERGRRRPRNVRTVRAGKAGLIWSVSRPFSRGDRKAATSKSVQYRPAGLRDSVVLHRQGERRDPARPVIRIVAPSNFAAGEPCYVVQTPPCSGYAPAPRPGVQVGGIWPRPLSWGFEWRDAEQLLRLRRDEPSVFKSFKIGKPAAHVRLVETEMTPKREGNASSIVDGSNYANKTFSMVADAKAHRAATLVRLEKP